MLLSMGFKELDMTERLNNNFHDTGVLIHKGSILK